MNMHLNESPDTSMQSKVEKLESSVGVLLDLCRKLSEENEMFKGSNKQLMQERSELQLKNDKVKAQVDAMIERLKALDKAS